MKIFPLGVGGKIVLILVAIVVIAIWSMLMWPSWWRKVFAKRTDEARQETVQEPPPIEEKRRRGRPPKQNKLVAP